MTAEQFAYGNGYKDGAGDCEERIEKLQEEAMRFQRECSERSSEIWRLKRQLARVCGSEDTVTYITELEKELLELYRKNLTWARPYERESVDKRIDELGGRVDG